LIKLKLELKIENEKTNGGVLKIIMEVEKKRENRMAQVKVRVMLKPSLLDAQGRVVQDALHSLGYGEVGGVRIGKYLELEIEEGLENQDARIREMCDKLLANPVIENYTYELVSTTGGKV